MMAIQILIIILVIFTIVILISKKWKKSLYSVISILLLLLFMFFSTSSSFGFKYVFGYEQVTIQYLPDKIELDGKIAKSFCDCPKCRIVSNFNFTSQFKKGIWIFEFSRPISEIMNPEDDFLLYKFTFIEEVSNYPMPEEKYNEFFVII